MNEVTGDLWKFEADYRCITTNGFVKKNGSAVMGRGCALEATQRYPDIAEILGQLLKIHGNHVHELGYLESREGKRESFAMDLLSFPVKHHWMKRADLSLIRRSAEELRDFMDKADPGYTVVVPRPGCGNGQLSWTEVKPILVPYFDERFYVIDYA